MAARTRIEVGQELVFVAPTGRRIPVVVRSLHPYRSIVTVAQIADLSKVKEVMVEELRTQDDGLVATQRMLDCSAKMEPLNAALCAEDRYECLECGTRHNRQNCPNCGGSDRIEAR